MPLRQRHDALSQLNVPVRSRLITERARTHSGN
jgi:hypothetical protein